MKNLGVSTDEFNGQCAALKSFEDHRVIGGGDDPESALNGARAKGVAGTVLVYVPEN